MSLNNLIKTVKQKSSSRRNLISKICSLNSAEINNAIFTATEKHEQTIIKNLLTPQNDSKRVKTTVEEPLVNKESPVESATTTKDKKENDDEDEDDDDDEAKSKHEHEVWDDVTVKEENKGVKNDYCQHFVDTAQRPQNFIRDAGLADRFEEYPKLRELIKLKDDLISKTNVPPMYLKYDFNTNQKFSSLFDCEFDVILVEPPLEEYKRTNGVLFDRYFSWDEIKELDLENIASQRSFIFLWCGSADGLDKGRECMKKWGFRRCEDICWIKTNRQYAKHNRSLEPDAVFQRTKEHCLMGIKGTVRRSVDNDFIHANVDIDIIISDEPDYGNPDKPEEIFNIIEHFCNGKRRLYLFGRDSTIRDGWVTVGHDLTYSNYDKEKYKCWFEPPQPTTTGTTERIDQLRPKSPPLKTKLMQQAAAAAASQQQQQANMFSANSNNITATTSQQPPQTAEILTADQGVAPGSVTQTSSQQPSHQQQTNSDLALTAPTL